MSLTLLALLLCLPTARAQSGYPGGGSGSGYPGSSGWVAKAGDPVVTGTVSGNFTDAQGHVSYLNRPYVNDGSSPPPLGVNAGESLTYKVNGTVTYTWTWNGGPNNLPPPSPQGVRETATAGASGGGDASGAVTATASDGGIGKENKTDNVSADGKTQSHGDGFGGSKIVTMDGSSGTLTVTGTVQAECDLSEPKSSGYPGGGYPGGGYPGGGYPGSGGSGTLSGSAGGCFTAVLDTRTLTISADVDATNTKQTLLIANDAVSVDGNGDENYIPWPNKRKSDGTMLGDTTYSYNTYQLGSISNPAIINWRYFTPNFGGSWHWKMGQDHLGETVSVPDVVDPNTWSWSPNESEDNWDYGKCSMPLATNYTLTNGYPKGQDAPTTYNVTYSATDNTDGVSATAKYVMTVHDPYEKNFPDHTQDMTDDANAKQLGTYGPQAPFDGSTISASVTTENPWSVKVKASGEIPLPWLGGALGVDVEKSVTDDDKIGASCSDNHTHAGDYSYVEAVDHYIYHHGKVDTWSIGGYTGTQPYEIWEVGTPAHFLRLHTPYGNATPGPSPGH